MGYFPALAGWLVVTGAAWLAAVRGWFGALGLKGPALLLVLAFPPVIVTLTHGQTSFLVAALLHDTIEDFPAAGSTVKRFRTLIVRRPA